MIPAPVRGPLAALRARLLRRPGSEQEMALNRLALGLVFILYLHLVADAPRGTMLLVCYCLFSVALYLGLAFVDRPSHLRRFAALAIDMAVISTIMYENGETGAAGFPIYLWVVFGNGFRLGLVYLLASAVMAVIGFGVVVATTSYWRHQPALAGSLMFGLLTLPAYAGVLINKLSRARREAEAANRAKSYFLASVSHELRTPLTAIIGLGEHLTEIDTEPAERRDLAGTIVAAGQGLLSLINQLLEYSRLESGGAAIKDQPFELMPLLGSVRALMLVTARKTGLKLRVHVRAETPLRMSGDGERLREILVNLVGNAMKFTETGGVTIVADRAVDANGTTLLQLSVEDTGIGIAAEAQDRIFGSFVQADDTIIDRFGGTGLGLAICRQLVEQMGGRIWVESHPGEGSRFSFTAAVTPLDPPALDAQPASLLTSDETLAERLSSACPEIAFERVPSRENLAAGAFAANRPLLIDCAHADAAGPNLAILLAALPHEAAAILIDPDLPPALLGRSALSALGREMPVPAIRTSLAVAQQHARRPSGDDGGPAPVSPPRRVLLADDNAMNGKVFQMMLSRAGHDIAWVRDGEAALERMRDERFDIVLMDVNMPVLNGVEATKLYRFTSLGQPRVPIVGITADASIETVDRCLEAGMDACVAKPVEARALLGMIDQLTEAAVLPAASAAGFDPSGTVVPLFTRETVEEPAIDPAPLREMAELGGEAFVLELVGVYRDDAAAMLAEAADAAARADVQGFRDATHALRSSASNVGAVRLAELCRHYQKISVPEFEVRRDAHVRALGTEMARVEAALLPIEDESRRLVAIEEASAGAVR